MGRWPAVLGWITALVVAGAVVGGIWHVGGPFAARRAKLDAERVDRIVELVWAVRQHFDEGKQLAKSLDEVDRYLWGGSDSRVDPETSRRFEYRKVGEKQFEICAVFDTDASKERRGYSTDAEFSVLYQHRAGRQCFRFAVGTN